jgi:hypothetical protein
MAKPDRLIDSHLQPSAARVGMADRECRASAASPVGALN